MITLIRAEKAYGKTQFPFMTKNTQQTRNKKENITT